MVCKKSPFESDLKASVQLGNSQFLYFFLLKKTPPWPGRRSSPPPPPRCQRPSSSLLAAGHNQLPLETLGLKSTGVVVSTH